MISVIKLYESIHGKAKWEGGSKGQRNGEKCMHESASPEI